MKKAFVFIFAANVLLYIVGCNSEPSLLRKEIIGDWQVERIEKKLENIQFNNITTGVVDAHSFKISGNISCRYIETSFETRTSNYRSIYDDGTYRDWKPTIESREETKKKKYIPDKLDISNPYGSDIELPVDPEGNFVGTIGTDPKYYFLNAPSTKPYYSLYNYTSPSNLVVRMSIPDDYIKPDKFVNSHSLEYPQIFFMQINVDEVKNYAQNYVKNKLSQISLSFKEQITRRNVSPQITITPIDIPSYENCITELRGRFGNEFAGDDDVIKIAMDSAKDYLNYGLSKVRTDISQSIHFMAWVGGTYRIETVHGEYNYFSGLITPSSSGPLSKTVLLVEKGEKIRTQEVREGEGGSMVDSD